MRTKHLAVTGISCLIAVACATPTVQPIAVQPVAPGAGEQLVVDHSITIVDTSGSISRREQYPSEKALVQSLVASAPSGKYESGAIAFGGTRREVHTLAPFDRSAMASYAGDLTYLSEGTPLDQAFNEAGAELKGKSDHAAITVVSDGLPTDVVGREVPQQKVLDAAAAAAKGYNGQVCIHTVQVGNDAAGAAFLEKLSKTTGCGSHRSASSLNTAAAIQSFQRGVYIGAAPVARAVDGDDDGDGVLNSKDRCPNTPKLVKVDERGCWASRDVYFETNSAEIDPKSKELLRTLGVAVLKANPDLRVRVDGHTDARGSDAYNLKLSERRAASVRNFFIAEGIEPGRLESRGFGESQPAAPNDTPENMQLNRRVEFTPL
jgi:OOP family OmpA-OmpF porin